MSEFKEYNHDGSYYEYDTDAQTGDTIIHHNQDVKAAVDWASKQRNHGVNDLGGKRDNDDLKHYATVSMGAILSMRRSGIDFWNKDHEPAMLKWIEQQGPKCKVTNRKIVA